MSMASAWSLRRSGYSSRSGASRSKKDGACLLYLPPYSPDFNPIEMAFAKLKAWLRKAAARTIEELRSAIAEGIEKVTPTECENFFAAAGYDQD